MIRRNFTKSNLQSLRRFVIVWCVVILNLSPIAYAADARIFAAASTTKPITEIISLYGQRIADKVIPVFAASGSLARQIDQGAPADIYLSANPRWMDWLERRNRLQSGSRRNLVGNCLVLTQPQGTMPLPILSDKHAPLLAQKRFAIGDPNYVPVGEYALSALKRLNLIDAILPRAVRMPSARHVLFLLERGEADAGIIYRSDAISNSQVLISANIQATLHDEIVYPLALVDRPESSSAAKRFFEFLGSDRALTIFKQNGFRILEMKCSN